MTKFFKIFLLLLISKLYIQNTYCQTSTIYSTNTLIQKNRADIDSTQQLKPVDRYTFHFQATVINQKHPGFNAAFNGKLGINGGATLDNRYENATSLTSTIFFGMRLWKGASAYFNPEISGGRGFSAVTGIAGFPNGEVYRVGSPAPIPLVARVYLQQDFRLSVENKYQENDINSIAGSIPAERITLRAGKYSLLDFFDDNEVSHDPRTDFLNWALMGMGAWDYPADTKGYTYAITAAYYGPKWSFLLASSTMPTTGNGPVQDLHILKAHSFTFQAERSYEIENMEGKIKVILYDSKYNGPYYNDLIQHIKMHDTLAVNLGNGYRAIKWGGGINLQQNLNKSLSFCFRASWNDGHAATWAFTPIDRSYSAGIKLSGNAWKRPQDILGISGVINGISAIHRLYLADGGLDFLIGDGKLPIYSMEKIAEVFYAAKFGKNLIISPDYQFINSPAYNPLRGPVNVFSLRAHIEF